MSKVRVVVGSKNPCKIAAVRQAFEEALEGSEIEVIGVSTASGVSDQPMGAQETLLGVYNRLRGAVAAVPDADYWAAIEGGVAETACSLPIAKEASRQFSGIAFAGVAARREKDSGARVSVSQTASFPLPTDLSRRIVEDHEELGPACDKVFATHDTKSNQGAIGHLTHGKIPRGPLYIPAVHMALIPFINPSLTFDLPLLGP